jgi:Phage tail sheath protein.
MAGMFTLGEVKVRPGAYSNIQSLGNSKITGAMNGVTAVVFKSDWGPLNEVVEVSREKGNEELFGTALTADIIGEAMKGGAKRVLCCRIGEGGTISKVILLDKNGAEAIEIASKYVGAREFSVSIREKLSDATKKECIIYQDTKAVETLTFEKGAKEIVALVAAFSKSVHFNAVKLIEGNDGEFQNVAQQKFTKGTNPTVTTGSYSEGLLVLESEKYNTICVDTEDQAVHILLASYLDRIYDAGQFGMGVVAEKEDVTLTERMGHAVAFNNHKMHYVVNPRMKTSVGIIDGYQTAARVAGLIAATPASRSLTHMVIEGGLELMEKITPTQIIEAETKGCLVLTMNGANQVWIDSGINTLTALSDNQDEGWKKIRRTKTRFELVTRAVAQADSLIGKVDNDTNGRATIVSQVQGIGTAMIEEGKLVSCNVTESIQVKSEGDNAYFDIEAIDKDSAEHIYLTFKFGFSSEE